MRTREIWVIDDDIIYKTIMKKIIQKSEIFHSTLLFSNGKEAIDALKGAIKNKALPPDIILLDIEMPVMDGWGFMAEFAKFNLEINSEIKIYISSSSISVEDKMKAKNNPNILGYMSKPISLNDLKLIAAFD